MDQSSKKSIKESKAVDDPDNLIDKSVKEAEEASDEESIDNDEAIDESVDSSDESIASPTYEVNHDDEVFQLLSRILSATVMYSFGEEQEKIYQLFVDISAEEIFSLTEKMKIVFLEQPTLLRINDQPITVVADLHGQVTYLNLCFQASGPIFSPKTGLNGLF